MESVQVHIAVLSIADPSAHADLALENIVADRATAAGHRITEYASVRDSEIAIRAQLVGWIEDPDIDLVLVVGEGASTAGALAPLVEQALPGFADLLRMLAFQEIGASAMLSNPEAARCGSTFVFVLPAGVDAVRAALDKLILPQLDPRTKPRNLIASMPRLGARDVTQVDYVPSAIPRERTESGPGPAPKRPAVPEERMRSRTGANVISRKVEDPTKPIDLANLEHQIALSNTGGEETKRVDLGRLPSVLTGATEEQRRPTEPALAAPPRPAHAPTDRRPTAPAVAPPPSARAATDRRPTEPDPEPAPPPAARAAIDRRPTEPAVAVPPSARAAARPLISDKPFSHSATPRPQLASPARPRSSRLAPPVAPSGASPGARPVAPPVAPPVGPPVAPGARAAIPRIQPLPVATAAPQPAPPAPPARAVTAPTPVAASAPPARAVAAPPSVAAPAQPVTRVDVQPTPAARGTERAQPPPAVAEPAPAAVAPIEATPLDDDEWPSPAASDDDEVWPVPAAGDDEAWPVPAADDDEAWPVPAATEAPVEPEVVAAVTPPAPASVVAVAPAPERAPVAAASIAPRSHELPAPLPASSSFADLPQGEFAYPVQLRRSRAPLVIALALLAAGIGAAAMLLVNRDEPRPAGAVEVARPVEAVAIDAAPAVEPDAAAAPEVAAAPPDAAVVEPEPPAAVPEPKPTTRRRSRSRGEAAAPDEPPPEGETEPEASEATSTPDPIAKVEPASADCDEVACVLEKYARPCCARYKPSGDNFKPTAGTPERLDRPQIKAGIEKLRPRVIACGEEFPVKGTVKLSITVDPEGNVSELTVQTSPDVDLGDCVATALRKAQFAKTVNGGSFTYPFAF